MQQKQLTAAEYEMLQPLNDHFNTARVGYVRGLKTDGQKILRQVHDAHFGTYAKSGPALCSACSLAMLRDLLPLYDNYQPVAEVPAETKKTAKKKTTSKKKA